MDEKDLDRDDLPIIRELMKLLDYYEPVYKQIPNWATTASHLFVSRKSRPDIRRQNRRQNQKKIVR